MENQRVLRSQSAHTASGAIRKRQSSVLPGESSHSKRQRTRSDDGDEEMQDMGNFGDDLGVEGEVAEGEIMGDNDGELRPGGKNNEDQEDQEDALGKFKSGKPKKGVPGQGVRSKQWDFFKKHIIEGAKRLPGGVLTYASTMTSQLAGHIAYSKNWTQLNRPVVTMEVLLSRLPNEDISGVWTQEKEDELKARFEASPLRAYTAKKRDVHNHFWSLWRKTCQLREVFPTDIIGSREYLEYGEKVEVAKGVWEPNPNWPRSFCEALDFLVIASPCRGDMGLLSLFIRYTVACSINDRRCVPMDKSRLRNPYFHKIDHAMKKGKGSMSLPEVGLKVRQVWERENLEVPWEGRVLSILEEDGFDEETEPFVQGEGAEFQLYAVTANHLKVLTNAFRTVGDLGVPMFSDMDGRFRVVSNSRSGKDAPKDWKDLTKLRLPLLLADMRVREKRLLEGSSKSNPNNELSPSSSGEEIYADGLEIPDSFGDEVPESGPVTLDVEGPFGNNIQRYTGDLGNADMRDRSKEDESSKAYPLTIRKITSDGFQGRVDAITMTLANLLSDS
ncbi:hypothetical protein F4774DRAFT_425144 [Daldinia eschscholtzii]|nr:hypothetical protein F4774DRAFT_425144 [Daldinia eschscholtzii]